MRNAISTISVLTLLAFSVACRDTAPPEEGGYLELAGCVDGATGASAAGRLSITGLHQPSDTRVDLAGEGSVVVWLPAGLYAVEGVPGFAADGADDSVVPVLSKPALVVISPGHVSTLYVHVAEAAPPAAVSALAIR